MLTGRDRNDFGFVLVEVDSVFPMLPEHLVPNLGSVLHQPFTHLPLILKRACYHVEQEAQNTDCLL